MRKRALLLLAAFSLSIAGFTAGGFLSWAAGTAQANDEPVGAPMWLGDEPHFLTSIEATADWEAKAQIEQEILGDRFRIPLKAPGILTQSETPEGDQILHEVGLVDSLLAQTVRCVQIDAWLSDPSVSLDEANQLAATSFEDYSSKDVVKELGDIQGYKQLIEEVVAVEGSTAIEAERKYLCDGLLPDGGDREDL